MNATERAHVDELIAKDPLIAEVVAGLKVLDERRKQEFMAYVEELLEEQRAELRAAKV